MKILSLLIFPIVAHAAPLPLDPASLHKIGLKVWHNECRGTIDGLVHWNANEPFPSLGIGHFIWYPKKEEKVFEETFPSFVSFVKQQDPEFEIPSWIGKNKPCPWDSQEAFTKDKRSKKMLQLRDFLSGTIDKQFLFLHRQFEKAKDRIVPALSAKQKKHLDTLLESEKGTYALIDYVNFKGIGLSPQEKYRGQGWGLLQVLQGIPDDTSKEALVDAFVTSAKKVLNLRVRNAPIHKNESRWLKGWFARVDTYRKSM